MRDVEVVVIGAGVMGSAAAWRLAKRGREVMLLEQFELCHDRGSSHGAVRVFRFSYNDAQYVQMAMDALPLWRELEREAGRSILTVTGGYDFGPPDLLDGNVAALSDRGAPFELVDGAEVHRRFPAVSLPADTRVLHQPDAGVIAAELAVQTFAERAVHLGSELRERTPVMAIDITGEGVDVLTADETFRAKEAIVTAGPWARDLLARSAIELRVVPSRETVAFFAMPEDIPLPVLVEWSDPSPTYALPSPGQGVKVGWHRSGPEAHPDSPAGADDRVLEHLSRWAGAHYPSSGRQPHRIETCMYTNTSDEHFILERHGPVVVGSACSGHGFKFAPLIGERLAQLASV